MSKWEMAKRLDFVAGKLRDEGRVNRSDLMREFGVSEMTASSDMSRFQRERPDWMRYDVQLMAYVPAAGFPRELQP